MEREVGLLDIGKHCSLCNNLDFLPFECDYCGLVFCADHRVPGSHNCAKDKSQSTGTRKPATSISKSSSSLSSSVDKYFPDRKNVIITPTRASPNPPLTPEMKANNAKSNAKAVPNALSRLKALLPKTTNNLFGNNKGSGIGTKNDNKPSAARGATTAKNLLALKQTAKGDTTIPALQRLYIYLQVPSTSTTTQTPTVHPVFVHRDWTVGKALDKLTEMLDIANENNTTSDVSRRWKVVDIITGDVMAYGVKFSSTDLKNGHTIAIKRGE